MRKSWKAIFDNLASMHLSLRNVKVDVFGTMATVVLDEEITYSTGATRQSQSVMVTNIFQHEGSSWL